MDRSPFTSTQPAGDIPPDPADPLTRTLAQHARDPGLDPQILAILGGETRSLPVEVPDLPGLDGPALVLVQLPVGPDHDAATQLLRDVFVHLHGGVQCAVITESISCLAAAVDVTSEVGLEVIDLISLGTGSPPRMALVATLPHDTTDRARLPWANHCRFLERRIAVLTAEAVALRQSQCGLPVSSSGKELSPASQEILQRYDTYLKQLTWRLEESVREVDQLKRSHSYRLGSSLVNVYARKESILGLPGRMVKALKKLPKPHTLDLGLPEAQVALAAPPSVGLARRDAQLAQRMLARPLPHRRPRVACVMSPSQARELSSHADLTALHPNDYLVALDRAQPDFLLVSSDADSPYGPWQYVGTHHGGERNSELLDLVELAAAKSIPVVLWYTRPFHETPALHALEALSQAVFSSESRIASERQHHLVAPVIDLQRYQPVSSERGTARAGVAYVGRPASRLGTRRDVLLCQAVQAALESGPISRYEYEPPAYGLRSDSDLPDPFTDLPVSVVTPETEDDVIHRHAAYLLPEPAPGIPSHPSGAALRLIATGCSIVALFDGVLAQAFPRQVHLALHPCEVPEQLRRSLAAPHGDDWELLRVLSRKHNLARLVDRACAAVGASQLRQTTLCVHATIREQTQLPRVVNDLLAQTLAPDEVFLQMSGAVATGMDEAIDRLRQRQIPVRIQVETASNPDPTSAQSIHATHEFLAPWFPDADYGPAYLEDLMCGHFVSRADVVGYAATGKYGPTDSLQPRTGVYRSSALSRSAQNVLDPESPDSPDARRLQIVGVPRPGANREPS